MRLLLVAGLAALVSVPAPAAARADLRAISLRQDVGLGPLRIAPPRRVASFRMRWARERPLRAPAGALTFPGGRAVVGLVRGGDAAPVAHAFGVEPVFFDARLRALQVSGSPDALRALDSAVGLDPRLRYVEPVRERRALHRRNDPLTTSVDPVSHLPFQWQFSHVGLDRALNVDRGSPTILVGVIDTGFGDVADLSGKVVRTWYFADQASDSYDTMGHGTFVSSLIAATNDDGRGMAGFCGSCRIAIVKDLDLDSYTISTAIRTLTDAKVRVLNMSFGGPGLSLLETDALSYAISQGVLLVAASGNDGGPVLYPGAYLQPDGGAAGYGLAVGASDSADRPAPWSNKGSRLSLLAPGTFTDTIQCDAGVLGALPPTASLFDADCGVKFSDPVTGARYAYSNGTSFAAPEVAGVAALVWAARPDLANYQLASLLVQSATRPAGSGWAPDRGWGVLNAARAIEQATGRSTEDRIVLGDARFSGRVEGGGSASVTADVTYEDGFAALGGAATCTADVGGRTLTATEQRFEGGSVRCSWDVPAAAGGDRLLAHVEVADTETGAKGSRDFEADVVDVIAPKAQAIRASGRYGARVTLRLRVSDETGQARRLVRVYRGTKPLFSSRSKLDDVDSAALRFVVWKAPRRGLKGPYRFCVWAWDGSDNESDRSCARIALH